jgi:biopolymer transport protein ExbB/TolQ
MISARCAVEVMDRLLFSPKQWNLPIGIGSKNDFAEELNAKASMITNEGFIQKDRSRFIANDKDLLVLVFHKPHSRDAGIYVIKKSKKESIKDIDDLNAYKSANRDTLRNLVESASPRLWRLVESNYNPLTGLRDINVDDDGVLDLSRWLEEQVGSDGLNWIQSIVEASESSARAITLVSGPIQGLIYIFFFFAIILVFIEMYTLRCNNTILYDRNIIPLLMREEKSSTIQRLINKARGVRINCMLSEEIRPNVVLDLAEPGYKFLLSYSGTINNAEMHTVLEAGSNSVIEKMSSRYQIIRYFVVTIPSLGFIGTVLGIGQALGVTGVMTRDATAAERLLASHGLSSNLHVAFDTTLIGLVVSILLSLVVDVLETRSVGFVLKARKHIMENIGNIISMKQNISNSCDSVQR